MAFYSDKHSVFRMAHQGATGRGAGETQFSRGLTELNIDIICANSPQAKGRVERMNKTLQDRLVKELRLHGVSNAVDGPSWRSSTGASNEPGAILMMPIARFRMTRIWPQSSPGRRNATCLVA